jgi:hypothetical protein
MRLIFTIDLDPTTAKRAHGGRPKGGLAPGAIHELRNLCTALPPATAQAILGERSGQAKLNALFSLCLDTPIPRSLVVALGQQLDPVKRVRDARLRLEPQGIRILSTRYDREELERVGLRPPASAAFFFSTRR